MNYQDCCLVLQVTTRGRVESTMQKRGSVQIDALKTGSRSMVKTCGAGQGHIKLHRF